MIPKTACLLLVLTLASSLGTPGRASAAESYVRFCSTYQSMSPAQFAAAARRDSLPTDRIPDSIVVSAVKATLPDSANVSVVIRQYNLIAGLGEGKPEAVAEISQGGKSRFVIVRFTNKQEAISTTPIASHDVQKWYSFSRVMAAYMLLNDLLASDAVIPRLGCERAAEIQLYGVPGVLSEIQRALETTPEQDVGLTVRARLAYERFAGSSEAQGNGLTSETLSKLGKGPAIDIVYRDIAPGSPRAAEFDVVRLSNGSVRTYIQMTNMRGPLTMSSPALCVVGDARCASAYLWP